MAQPQEGTSLPESPLQRDPAAPREGDGRAGARLGSSRPRLAGSGEGGRSPGRGVGGQPWKELLLPERRALLYRAKRQGRLRAAFVRRGAAGGCGRLEPRTSLPTLHQPRRSLSLKPSILSGGSGQPPRTGELRDLSPQPCHAASRDQAAGSKQGGCMEGGSRQSPTCCGDQPCPSSPSPPYTAPCPRERGANPRLLQTMA